MDSEPKRKLQFKRHLSILIPLFTLLIVWIAAAFFQAELRVRYQGKDTFIHVGSGEFSLFSTQIPEVYWEHDWSIQRYPEDHPATLRDHLWGSNRYPVIHYKSPNHADGFRFPFWTIALAFGLYFLISAFVRQRRRTRLETE